MCLPMGNNGIIKYTLKMKKTTLANWKKKIFQMVAKYIILIFIGCDRKCSKLLNYINSLLLLFLIAVSKFLFWIFRITQSFFYSDFTWYIFLINLSKHEVRTQAIAGCFLFSFVLWLCLLVTIVDMLSLFFCIFTILVAKIYLSCDNSAPLFSNCFSAVIFIY